MFDLGDWDELLETADDLIEWDRSHGGSYFGVMALTYKAAVLRWRGRLLEAADLEAEFLPRARGISDPQILVPALALASMIEQGRSRSSAAVQLVGEIHEAAGENALFRYQSVADAVRVAVSAGDIDLARRLVEGATADSTRDRLAVLTAQAVVAEAERRLDDAVRLYRQARVGWEEFGHALERGLAFLGEGRCVLARGKSPEADGALKEARDSFVRLGAGALVTETKALLGEVTAGPS